MACSKSQDQAAGATLEKFLKVYALVPIHNANVALTLGACQAQMLLVEGHNTELACTTCHTSITQGVPGEGGMHASAQARDHLVMLNPFEPPPCACLHGGCCT